MTAVPPSPGLLIPAPRHEETRLLLLLQQLHFFFNAKLFCEPRVEASGERQERQGRGVRFLLVCCVRVVWPVFFVSLACGRVDI